MAKRLIVEGDDEDFRLWLEARFGGRMSRIAMTKAQRDEISKYAADHGGCRVFVTGKGEFHILDSHEHPHREWIKVGQWDGRGKQVDE